MSQSDLLKIAVNALALLQERDAVAGAFRAEGADRVVRLGLSSLRTMAKRAVAMSPRLAEFVVTLAYEITSLRFAAMEAKTTQRIPCRLLKM